MKTELQKRFEEQTPTIRGRSTIEYLQTFVTWLHLQVEKNYGSVSDDEIGELVKDIAYTQHHEEQSEDFLEKVWIIKEWLQSLPKAEINKDNKKVRPLTEGKEKRNSKKNPNEKKTGRPPTGLLPTVDTKGLWKTHSKLTKRGFTVYQTMTFKEFEAAINELKNQ